MIYNKPGGFLGDCIRIDDNNNNNNKMFGTRWDPTPQKSQLTKFPLLSEHDLFVGQSQDQILEGSKVVLRSSYEILRFKGSGATVGPAWRFLGP